jgi:hypothetical protein
MTMALTPPARSARQVRDLDDVRVVDLADARASLNSRRMAPGRAACSGARIFMAGAPADGQVLDLEGRGRWRRRRLRRTNR